MTKEELKILLRDFRNMQAQLNYLKELSNDQTISQTTFHEKERMLRLIESALTVLDKRERFVIETHLMNQETWTETSRKLQDCFGTECIFRKNCASVPEELSAIPLQTEQSSAG